MLHHARRKYVVGIADDFEPIRTSRGVKLRFQDHRE
jgi:hypothetical protein